MRIGHGYDIHRIEPGGTLMIAGVAVSDEMHAVAHSDGDVAIHALVDAILGAMGLGDIGQHFPNSDPKWKDADSEVFLRHVTKRLKIRSWKLMNADVTILAERPKLNPFRVQMIARLSEMLECKPEQINVKAGTNEGCDAVGRGEAVAAHAVVLLAVA